MANIINLTKANNNMMTVMVNEGKVTYVHADYKPENVGEIRAIKREHIKGGPVVIANIPARLMSFDTRYQIPERVNRSKVKLIQNFDIRKMCPLVGVIHEDEGYVAILDGVGRLTATQSIDSEKYEILPVMLLMDAPENPKERLRFEAEYFAMQDDNNAKVKPYQKHGALVCCGDYPAILIENAKSYYPDELSYKGQYQDYYRIAKRKGADALDFVLHILKESRMASKRYGVTRYLVRSIADMYRYYGSKVERVMIDYLRPITAQQFKADAVHKYPKLSVDSACSLYSEDIVVKEMSLKHKRMIDENNKLVEIA